MSDLKNFLLLIPLLLLSCSRVPENTDPVAFFEVSPESGDTETRFILDASGTHDAEDPDTALFIRWDYENDGIFDYPFVKTRINIHQFALPGNYTVKLQVRDGTGNLSEFTREVPVSQGNKPPLVPFSPNPYDSAGNIRFVGRLSWVGIDPDDTRILYDIYLGLTSDPELAAAGLTKDEYYPQNLIPGNKYYWRVVSKDPGGNAVTGPVWSFSIHSGIYVRDTLTDPRDGQKYPVLLLGSRWWMARNLNYDHPDWSVIYNNDPRNGDKYGRLYSRFIKDTIVCPPGWTVPRDADWAILEKHLGMDENSLWNTGWRGVDQGAQLLPDGTSGMDLQLGGYGNSKGHFQALGEKAFFRYPGSPGRMVLKDYRQIYRHHFNNQDDQDIFYFSIRCIRIR